MLETDLLLAVKIVVPASEEISVQNPTCRNFLLHSILMLGQLIEVRLTEELRDVWPRQIPKLENWKDRITDSENEQENRRSDEANHCQEFHDSKRQSFPFHNALTR